MNVQKYSYDKMDLRLFYFDEATSYLFDTTTYWITFN